MPDDQVEIPDPTPGASRRRLLTGMGAAAAGAGFLAFANAAPAEAETTNATYYTFGPTRFVDTRNAADGGPISAGQTRTYSRLAGAGFTIVANITVVNTAGYGYLAIFNADGARPSPYSTINWQGAGKIVANLACFDLGNAGFSVYCGGSAGTKTDFIIDTVGQLITPTGAAIPPAVRAWQQEMLRRRDKELER